MRPTDPVKEELLPILSKMISLVDIAKNLRKGGPILGSHGAGDIREMPLLSVQNQIRRVRKRCSGPMLSMCVSPQGR